MTTMLDATVVLLTWNEEDGVRALLPKLGAIPAVEKFAMDGGSTDRTVELLREGGWDVYRQASPGRGSAIIEGVKRARRDIVVLFSPDGNEDPEDIPRLIRMIEDGADVAIASRFLPESRNEEDDELLPARAWANRAFTGLANLLWNRGDYVTDTINGFRAFRRSSFLKLGIDMAGFTIEYQSSIRAMKTGMTIREIPTIEGNRIGGRTKAPSIATGLRFLRFLVREAGIGRNWREIS